MSSHPAHTHTTSAPPRGGGHATSAPHHGGGLSLATLLIAAASSAAAATVVSRLWQAGTVMAAAMTPVVVSLVKEALERPAKRVSSIATRSAAPPVARAARAVTPPPPGVQAPPPPMVGDPRLTEMRVYGDARRVRRRWKLAVATGLLGFVVCVAAMTLPELVAGRSVVSGKNDTTIFGGQRRAPATTSKPEEKTKTDEGQTTTNEIKPQDEAPPTDQPDGTTTTGPQQPTQPAPQGQPAPAPSQTQPPQTQPTVPEQQPAPTTP
jgi:outer membrane biosynthesis protein TonB